jgi:UDP-glucuronate 4-epimerase
MVYLVTGCAGFIGFHVSKRLLESGYEVVGIDNINDYYDTKLKFARLSILKKFPGFTFCKNDICNEGDVEQIFLTCSPQHVIHLAAQAGVRNSISSPRDYLENNLIGFFNILDSARRFSVDHFVYASTSSVYGANELLPFSEINHADHPIQFYAATKRSNELMAHSYSSVFDMPTSGVRFFTVYGPWGRPDMALFKFTHNILNREPIRVFNHGNHMRDFTYIDDIVSGILTVSSHPAQPNPQWDPLRPDPSSSKAPFQIYNIGNSTPVNLMKYIQIIEEVLGKKAIINFEPMQQGDVKETVSDISKISKLGYEPSIDIETGIKNFISWYKQYINE